MSWTFIDKVTGTYGNAADLVFVHDSTNFLDIVDECSDGEIIEYAEDCAEAKPANALTWKELKGLYHFFGGEYE